MMIKIFSAHCQLHPSGFFEFAERGKIALIVKEHADFVAARPATPWLWWLRYGRIELLGADGIERAPLTDTPLILHENPTAWIKADQTGAVILDWRCDPRAVFSCVPVVECTSVALSDRLRQRVTELSAPHFQIKTRRRVG